MRTLGLLLMGAVLVAVTPAGAGDVKPGDRVKFTGPQVDGVVGLGEVAGVENGRLLLRMGREERLVRVDRDALATLEVYRPRQTKTGKGAAIGGGVGVLLGASYSSLVVAMSCGRTAVRRR